MKKFIAFGTAASLLAMTAVVAGAASTVVKTSLSLKLDSGSLENVKAGDQITVVVYTENEGETPAAFNMKTAGVKLLSATVPAELQDMDTGDAFNIVTKGEASVKGKDTVVCTFLYEITDPAAVSIEVVPDEDFSEVGANTVLTGTAAGSGSDSSDSEDSGDSNDSEDSGDSNDSEDSGDSSDSEPEASDSEPEASDSEPEASDSEPEASDSEPETSDSEPEASDSEPETSDSDTSTGTDSGTGSGSSSGSKDPSNVDTGIGFVLAPAVLAGAALIISRKRK